MRISDVMARRVEVVDPDDVVRDCAARMRELGVGALPVVEDDRLLGMVTDRDITVRVTAFGLDPKRVRVRQVMSRGVIYCHEDDDVRDVARVMKEKQIRRMPVVDRDGRLMGIVALGDLAVRGRDDRLSGEVLQGVSRPTSRARAVNGVFENGLANEGQNANGWRGGYERDLRGRPWDREGMSGRGGWDRDEDFCQDRWGREQGRSWEEDRWARMGQGRGGGLGAGGIGSEFPGGIGRQWGQGPHGQGQGYSGSFGQQGGMGQQRSMRRGPKNYTRSDERIREDVCDRLSDRQDVDVSDVTIRVQNGEVTLEGTVEERFQKYVIEQIADGVPGVKDVNNQLRVKRYEGTTETGRHNGGRDKTDQQQPGQRQDATRR